MNDELNLFGLLFGPDDEGSNGNGGEDSPDDESSADDAGANAQKSTDDKTNKRTFQERVARSTARELKKVAQGLEDSGIEVVYDDDGNPDLLSTFASRAPAKKEQRKGNNTREQRLEAERDALYIEAQLARATSGIAFHPDVPDAREDAIDLFMRRHTIKRDKRNGEVEISFGGEVLEDDNGKPFTLAEAFAEWIKTKPQFLQAGSGTRPLRRAGGEQTGNGGVVNENDFMNKLLSRG